VAWRSVESLSNIMYILVAAALWQHTLDDLETMLPWSWRCRCSPPVRTSRIFRSAGAGVHYDGEAVPTAYSVAGSTSLDAWQSAPGNTPQEKVKYLAISHSRSSHPIRADAPYDVGGHGDGALSYLASLAS